MHLGGQIDDVIFANRVGSRDRGRCEGFETLEVGEASLLFEAADAGVGVEHQFRNLEVRIGLRVAEIAKRILDIKSHVTLSRRRLVGEGNSEETRRGRGECDGVLIAAIVGNFGKLAKSLAVITGLHLGDGWCRTEHVGRRCALDR